jgi:rRNA maturation protein Nop10
MAQRQCEKCGEMTDEAKAFCPACGEAFVEETKRAAPSVFESMDGTMQLGNTMYNQMLSDMGLNISAKPGRSDDVTEPVIHIPPAAIPSPAPAVQPAVPAPKESSNKWLIAVLVALIALLFLLIVVLVIAFVVWNSPVR